MHRLRKLSSLFGSAIKATTTEASSSGDPTLKNFVSSLDTSSPSVSKRLIKSPKRPSKSKKHSPPPSPSRHSRLRLPPLNQDLSASDSEDSRQVSEEISSILYDGASINPLDSQDIDSEKSLENELEIPWLSNLLNSNISLRRKEVSRERKQKWVFKCTQVGRFDRLVNMCAKKLGTEATLEVFGKLGRETGVKEFNALMKLCIDRARETDDEDVALEQIYKAYQIFTSMKDQGFPVEESTYGPFLMYLIDMRMVEEFHFFSNIIKDCNPTALARLGYFEMLLYIRVNNEEKIKELCNFISTEDGDETADLRENFLLALCESDRKKDLLQLLEIIDITNLPSVNHVASIFKCLGRLSLEAIAEKFLLVFKNCDYGAKNISTLIFSYATSIPNLAVEDVVLKFKNLHIALEMTPTSKSLEKLILYSCDLHKVHLALDMVDQMCEAGLALSIDTINYILHTSEENLEFNLVQRIYSLICHHDLKPNNETFRSMISLSVKMKDFDGAYGMLNDLKKLNLMPTASMYNAIMGGYFREKNINGALMVLKQMELADVKPDSQTYSYLIGNCNSEKKIVEYYEEMKFAGVQVSKQIFMALINAYATCGQFEKAKEVLLDQGIPVKNLSEIKSVLVSALASHGQMSDALDIYEEIKEAGFNLEPKAAISLIEYYQSEGELSRLIKLLEELHDPEYWVDGCRRIVLYCVRNKHISSAVDLLKQLKDTFCNDELAMEVLFDEVFSLIAETEPTDLQIGLDLLQAIKDDLGIIPSRKCLDFLLGACVKAKDLRHALLIWREYQAAGLPYNVITYLRMYQALLASESHVSAKIMLPKIPKDDPHVRIVIQASQKTWPSVKGKKKKKRMNKQ